MWITGDVELPDEIIDAHERGQLVFFVGAGASAGKPSSLPLFDGLAKRLARKAAHRFSARGGLDFFLGQLDSLPQGFDVHRQTLEMISDPKSQFNQLHGAIMELAVAGGELRVVTTNYDDHLTAAAKSKSVVIPNTWYAPALPLGNDFTGIVHLHGSIRRPKEELILTDRDFGRAYITNAWAARFLLPMFEQFTVLFIGYSHDDVIMRYLALGLPSDVGGGVAKRFALTSDPTNAKWDYLGIRPIGYPAARDHQALTAALATWADRAKMGYADHRSRVRAIIDGGTALPLSERDYLCTRLRIVDGVQDFTFAADSLSDDDKLKWLTWLEDFDEFKSLFLGKEVTRSAAALGGWFATTFIGSPALNGAALQTLERLGQSMTPSLYQVANLQLMQLCEGDPVAARRWQAVLATSVTLHPELAATTDFSIAFLSDSVAPSPVALRAALRPFLKLQRGGFATESAQAVIPPNARVTWRSQENALNECIQLAVRKYDPGDRSLASALEDSVAAAYDLLEAYHGGRGWDPLSLHRSAIEPHAQDQFREPLDALIDGLRDYGIGAMSVWPTLPEHWWDVGRPLMRRLALHLVANDPKRSSDDRLLWLLGRTGLYEFDLKHEVFQLLADAIPDASETLRGRILQAAAASDVDYPEEAPDRERHIAYARYNLLAWLAQSDPGWVQAQTAFKAAQEENPSFAVREHPDFDMWMTGAIWDGQSPTDIEDFIQEVTTSRDDALDQLLSRCASNAPLGQSGWHRSLDLARAVAERSPHLGVQLWDAISRREKLGEKQVELWRAIVEGWGKASLLGSGLEAIARVTTLVTQRGSADAVGRFLFDQIHEQIAEDESPVLASMRRLAQSLWREQGLGFSRPEDSPPLSPVPLYLNSWPGFLAEYWSGEIDRRWRHSRDEWAGLTDEESSALVALLTDNQAALDATQPAIAEKLFFYFAADRTFSKSRVLPIFNDPERHAYGWYPFLLHPRCNDLLLQAGLLDSMVAELERTKQWPDQERLPAFLALIASVVSLAGIRSAERKRLLDRTVVALDGTHAEGFAQAVARFLRDDDVDGAAVWLRWLGRHLKRRLDGLPRSAAAGELARWADAVPFVGRFVPKAVKLLGGRGIGLADPYMSLQCPDEVLLAHGADLVPFFAERIRSTSSSDFAMVYCVRQFVQRFVNALGSSIAAPLVQAAVESGFLSECP